MANWEKAAARANRRVAKTFGTPCTYIRQSDASRISTRIIVEKDIEVMGQFVDVPELQTHGSMPVADIGLNQSVTGHRDSVIVVNDMAYHIRRMVSNDGFMAAFQLLPDPELHEHLKALDTLGHINRFINHEWGELWQTISTHRSVPLTGS